MEMQAISYFYINYWNYEHQNIRLQAKVIYLINDLIASHQPAEIMVF